MDFISKLNFKTNKALKIAGIFLLAIIIVVFAIRLIGSSFNSRLIKESVGNSFFPSALPSNMAQTKGYDAASGSGGIGLSVRNVTQDQTMPINEGVTTGDNAEEYEVTEYSALVETRQLNDTCAAVTSLKSLDYVIFENASRFDRGCNYVFKVKRDRAEDVLKTIKDLKPKELAENTYTIKKLVDDFTSQIDILENKLSAIDDTLKKAISAYDEVTALSVRIQNVETLAKIIDSKINIIERLTQERINVNSQLEQISRAKAEQLDRLEYTYFRVNILEDKFIDFKNLKDSWKAAIKSFVRDINQTVQDISINLIASLLIVLKLVIYLVILIFFVKYGWQLVKYIWKK